MRVMTGTTSRLGLDSTAATSWGRGALTTLLVLAAMAAGTIASADPLAVAVAVRGVVMVTPTGGAKAQRATLGRTLERGDRVQVGAGGAVTLFFSDGNVLELGEKSTVTVGGRVGGTNAPSGTIKSGMPTEVFARVSRFVANDSRSSGLMALAPNRGSAKEPAAMLLNPRRTQVLSGRPSFSWRAVEGATRYRLSVSGDQGEVWNRETDAVTLDYPADVPELTGGGEFLCEVRAMSDAGTLLEDDASFSVLSADEATHVTSDLDGIGKATAKTSTSAGLYLTASYLVGRGLYSQAIARFQELAKLTPDAAGPHEALGNVYRTVGLPELAAAEFQRALELSKTQQ